MDGMVGLRETRSGKAFSPYGSYFPLLCPPTFELGPLLQQSILEQGDELEDHDGLLMEVDDIPTADATPSEPEDERPAKVPRLDPTPAAPSYVPRPPPPHLSPSHKRRWRKREAKFGVEGHQPRPNIVEQRVKGAEPIRTELRTEKLPAANGAYVAKNGNPDGAKKVQQVEELLARGFDSVPWEGIDSSPLLDRENRVFSVLVGRPDDESYAAAATQAYDALSRFAQDANFTAAERKHRRGAFPAVNVGVHHGKGTPQPMWVTDDARSEGVDALLNDPAIQRLAAFGSSSFRMWCPGVFDYYQTRLNALWKRMPFLRRAFDKSIFPCSTFNFGPNVWTYKHRDPLNCPFGWCAVYALGNFDPKRGGHIILWEVKKVIEFPPGSLILLPSATITHSNIPVAPGDSRASFTQYCAGGIFRYVDYGFRTAKALADEDPEEYSRMESLKDGKWKAGLELFSTLDELQQKPE
ncbi:hypothetical protein FPV67DRAFT_1460189 [Lyophyllum atratum]|nr:hypothetical protein FPV67DRAFT_1460189 [Lyophyllum atratum]